MASKAYGIELVDGAFDHVLGLEDTPYARTTAFLELLALNPGIGRVYAPEYDAMLPPIECRRVVVPRTTVELFYYVDESRHSIKVIHACDARSDPRSKFVGLHVTEPQADDAQRPGASQQ